MVDLADEEAAPHVPTQSDRGFVGRRHRSALERRIAAPVDDLAAGRFEEQGEEDPGDHEDQKAVEGDLAEHEREVVREHLPHRPPQEPGPADAFVEEAGRSHGDTAVPRLLRPGLPRSSGPAGFGRYRLVGSHRPLGPVRSAVHRRLHQAGPIGSE